MTIQTEKNPSNKVHPFNSQYYLAHSASGSQNGISYNLSLRKSDQFTVLTVRLSGNANASFINSLDFSNFTKPVIGGRIETVYDTSLAAKGTVVVRSDGFVDISVSNGASLLTTFDISYFDSVNF